jgi:hypothetical protein
MKPAGPVTYAVIPASPSWLATASRMSSATTLRAIVLPDLLGDLVGVERKDEEERLAVLARDRGERDLRGRGEEVGDRAAVAECGAGAGELLGEGLGTTEVVGLQAAVTGGDDDQRQGGGVLEVGERIGHDRGLGVLGEEARGRVLLELGQAPHGLAADTAEAEPHEDHGDGGEGDAEGDLHALVGVAGPRHQQGSSARLVSIGYLEDN